jgi:hypothetical protein
MCYTYYVNERSLIFMKRKMQLTITFDENSEVYAVDTKFDALDLEAFLGGIASVLVSYSDMLAEEDISPADIGFLLTMHMMEELADDEAE